MGQNQNEPKLIDKREQVLDPLTAYQITSIMEGVIQRGTGVSIKIGGQTSRRQDRHDERRQGPLVRRLFAGPRRRRLHRLRPPALNGQPCPGRPLRRADLPRLHDGCAEGQAGHALPRAAWHQADLGRPALRDCALPAPERSSKPSSPARPRPTPIPAAAAERGHASSTRRMTSISRSAAGTGGALLDRMNRDGRNLCVSRRFAYMLEPMIAHMTPELLYPGPRFPRENRGWHRNADSRTVQRHAMRSIDGDDRGARPAVLPHYRRQRRHPRGRTAGGRPRLLRRPQPQGADGA